MNLLLVMSSITLTLPWLNISKRLKARDMNESGSFLAITLSIPPAPFRKLSALLSLLNLRLARLSIQIVEWIDASLGPLTNAVASFGE